MGILSVSLSVQCFAVMKNAAWNIRVQVLSVKG